MPKVDSNRVRKQQSDKAREVRQSGGRSRKAIVASRNSRNALRMKYGI